MEKWKGIKFGGTTLRKMNSILNLLRNINNHPNYSGVYFLCAKLINSNIFICIYVGSSSRNIKERLLDHINKFNNTTHDWYNWYFNHHFILNIIERDIYYFTFNTPYGIIVESHIISYNFSEIAFNLNISNNGHKKPLNYINIDYNFVNIYKFIEILEKFNNDLSNSFQYLKRIMHSQ